MRFLLTLFTASLFIFTTQAQDNMPADVQKMWNQAQALDKQKEYQKAVDIYKKAAEQMLLYKQRSDYQLIIGRIYAGIGKNYSPDRLAQFPPFFEYMEKATKAIQQTKDTQYKGEILYTAAVANFYYRKLNVSAKLLKEVLSLAALNKDKTLEIRASGLTGRVHMSTAQYDAALRYFERAERLTRQVPKIDNVLLGAAYFNLALINQQLEKFELSITYYKRTLDIWKKAYAQEQTSARIISVYYIMADLYVYLEKPKEARIYMEKVFAADSPQIRQQRGGHYYLKGRLLHLEKRFPEAIEAFLEAIKVQERVFGPNPSENTEIYRNLSDAYLFNKQFKKAQQANQKALVLNNTQFASMDISQSPGLNGVIYKETQSFTLAGKGKIWKAWYDHTKNLDYLKKSLDAYRFLLNQIKEWKLSQENESNLLIVLQYSRGFFMDAIDVLNALYQETNEVKYLNEAFLVAEQNKSYVLLRSLHLTNQSNTKGTNQLEAKLINQISQTQETLTTEQGKKTPNGQLINQYKESLFTLKASQDSLQNALKIAAPEYYRTKYQFQIASATTIKQGLLRTNDALIEYMVDKERMFIFTLTANNISLKKITLSSKFNDDLKTLRNSITQKDFQQFTLLSHRFYKTLIGNLSIPKQTKKLWIIPDGALYYLPWETLLVTPYNNKSVNYSALDYLLKRYIISYDYSANLIYSKQVLPPRLKTEKLLAFSPDFKSQLAVNDQNNRDKLRDDLGELKGAQEEVNVLNDLYAGELFIGQKATEYQFKNNLTNGSVLHLATHAIVDDERPAFSRLVFSLSGQDTLNDGYLHAFELYNLKLNTELVTLSACNTGFGKILSGEGVMSLGRAFAYAGSPNVLMSLWSVPDKSTSQIMIQFYKNLAEGMTKDEALQKAKLAYLAASDNMATNPFYWSSFVLIGDPKPLSLQPQTPFYQKSLVMWLIGMLLIGGVFLIVFRRY